jgi:hypothetical protein
MSAKIAPARPMIAPLATASHADNRRRDRASPRVDAMTLGKRKMACRPARARSSRAACGSSTNLILQRRVREARAMFECLLALRNDVGLLAEEYGTRCQMGNFPQVFSHVALVNTAYNFTRSEGPAEVRAGWGTQMIVQAARKSVPFNRRLLSRMDRDSQQFLRRCSSSSMRSPRPAAPGFALLMIGEFRPPPHLHTPRLAANRFSPHPPLRTVRKRRPRPQHRPRARVARRADPTQGQALQ